MNRIGGCTWGDGRDPAGCNKNGFVYDNVIGPGDFGYGIAVGGALDFTVHGNGPSSLPFSLRDRAKIH